MERNLGSHLRGIYERAHQERRTSADERRRIEQQKLEQQAVRMLDDLLPKMEQQARKGLRTVLVAIYHWTLRCQFPTENTKLGKISFCE